MMMRETAEEEPWKCKQIVPVARADPGDRTEYAGAIHAGAQPQQQATEKCRQSRCICRACREMTIGRATCREGGGKYVWISVVAVSFKKKKRKKTRDNRA